MEMMDATTLVVEETDDISYLLYFWLIPAIVGIPGNALAVIVANRKHNRQLSPCIYMTAMGVADTVLLLERIMMVICLEVFFEYGIITDSLARLWWLR
jgi:hypothetical protein